MKHKKKRIVIYILAVLSLLTLFAFWQIKKNFSVPKQCTDSPEGVPVITSISKASGPVGTKIEIKGCNFSGFEGDLDAWIEDEKGGKGILYGQEGSTPKSIQLTLDSPLCQQDNSYSGMDCTAWLVLSPGKYKIYVNPLGKLSNSVSFSIKL